MIPYLVFGAVVVVFVLRFFVFFGRCPSCRKWRCAEGVGITVAGEAIFSEAWCRFCSQPLGISEGGYIVYRPKVEVAAERDTQRAAFESRRAAANANSRVVE